MVDITEHLDAMLSQMRLDPTLASLKIPREVLLGESPGGLNAAESEHEHWERTIARFRGEG